MNPVRIVITIPATKRTPPRIFIFEFPPLYPLHFFALCILERLAELNIEAHPLYIAALHKKYYPHNEQ